MHGALAQLGARHTGSVEVTGSNPVCSRREIRTQMMGSDFFAIMAFMKLQEEIGCSVDEKRQLVQPVRHRMTGVILWKKT